MKPEKIQYPKNRKNTALIMQYPASCSPVQSVYSCSSSQTWKMPPRASRHAIMNGHAVPGHPGPVDTGAAINRARPDPGPGKP